MKKTGKKKIALLAILVLIAGIVPFKVFATDNYTYTLTFNVDAGTDYTLAPNMNGDVPRDGEILINDGTNSFNVITLKDGNNSIGAVSVSNGGKTATITVTNGPQGRINYPGVVDLLNGTQVVANDSTFTNNTAITVKKHTEPTNTSVNLQVSFRNYNPVQGHVEYSVDNGAHWGSLSANTTIDNLNIVPGYALQLKIVPSEGYTLDVSGTQYSEDTNTWTFTNNQNGHILGGLTGDNGYYVNNGVTSVKLEGVEFKQGQGTVDPIGEKVDFTLVWNDENKLCYHRYNELDSTITGKINYIKLSELTDESGNNGNFVNNDDWGWVESEKFFDNEGHVRAEFNEYPAKAAAVGVTDKSLAGLILYGVDPFIVAEHLGIDPSSMEWDDLLDAIQGHEVQGVGTQLLNFGEGNNSVSQNVDNIFISIIYNDEEYAAVHVSENYADYEYFPGFWMTNTYNANVDISGTTIDNPAYIPAYLLNKTVTIQNSEVTDEFVSVTPLNVNENAVSVTNKGNGKFEISFASNYYDRVEFEIKTATKTFYAVVARTSIQVRDNFGPDVEQPQLIAEVYYPTEGYDENSFQVVATTIDRDGNKKIYVVDAGDILEDRFDVDMALWGTNLGKKIAAGYEDKVSLSRFMVNVDKTDIVGAYFTVVKKGAIGSDNYTGTFAGSGVGSYYDVQARKVVYNK